MERQRGFSKLAVPGIRACFALAMLTVVGVCADAGAFEIQTGNEDVSIHLDNTIRFTLADRVRGRNSQIVNSVNNDDGDRNFGPGLVSSRFDLLSEFDAVYKNSYGVRLSSASWYDPMYFGKLDNNSVGTSNHFVNGQQALGLNSYTKDQFGLNAELLDAFAFAKIDAGDVPINIRVGRHTIYWGEAFFPFAGNNGISYGQSPIDIGKALAMPGVELKEIFRPLNQVSVQVQPTKELTFAAQYYLQWESNLFPEHGSYLGMIDPFMNSGEAALTPGGPLFNGGDRQPGQTGDLGVMARWNSGALNSTFGLYYRNFSDKNPQVLADAAGYHLTYASDIDLYGISFAKNVLGVSVGSEISYRRNMPLMTTWFSPAEARGDTMHAVLNFLALLPKTPVFDGGATILEFTYGRYNKITKNAQFFSGNGAGGIDRPTRDNTTVAINLAPQWTQVLPGVDLTMPLSFSVGLSGISPVAGGGSKDNGSYSAGLSFDVFAKYKVDLTYASFFGTVHPDAQGQILPPGLAQPGQGAGDITGLLKDRDLLSLTFKTSF